MKCSDIACVLVANGNRLAWSGEHRAHLEACESCRRLAAVADSAGSQAAIEPLPESLRDMERILTANLRPVRRMAAKRHLVAFLVAIFVFFAGLGVLRLGWRGLTVMTPFQASMMLGALSVGAALLAWSLATQMSPGSLHRLSPASLPVAVTIGLAILTAAIFHFEHEHQFWMRSWQCIRNGAPFSLLAAIPIWFVLRRGAFLSPSVIGPGAGLFAGLAGALAIQIRCQNLEAAHILVSHLGMAALASVLGWILGVVVERAGRVLRRS
jgi:hypothetical protein